MNYVEKREIAILLNNYYFVFISNNDIPILSIMVFNKMYPQNITLSIF